VISNKIAEYLLEIKAVRFSLDPPFTWASGWHSPIYCDNRKTLSYPHIRQVIRDAFAEQIQARYPGATGIAGVATGAIAQGALVAEVLGLPLVYVRSQAKGHGLQNLVEGALDPEGQYVVIEDLISTGKSSVAAVRALQAAGTTVLGTLAIFSYGFPEAQTAYEATGTPFHTLTDMAALSQAAQAAHYLQPEQQAVIEQWQRDPAHWAGPSTR
jgi:orotate phosphoribosyltransferase